MLTHVADSWKELGNTFFKIKKTLESIEAYKKAIDIYNLPEFQGKYLVKELPLYSNLAITYSIEKRYPEAIAAANTALEIYEQCPADEKLAPIGEKIICNLIKALCAQAEASLLAKNCEDAHSLHLRAQCLIETHESRISRQIYLQMRATIETLQQCLASRLSRSSSESNLKPGNDGLKPIPCEDPSIASITALRAQSTFAAGRRNEPMYVNVEPGSDSRSWVSP